MKRQKVFSYWWVLGLLGFMFLISAPGMGQAATFTVNSPADTAGLEANCVSGVGTCTLRSAIQAANATAAADTIVIPVGTYTLTIAPLAGDITGLNGDLDIAVAGGPLIISGAGAATTIIDGGGIDRVFDVAAVSPIVISNVTIRNGNSHGLVGGGILTGGGGVSLTLNNVVISGNTSGVAGIEGDAIDIGGGGAVVTMNNVAIMNNTSLGGGNIIAVGAAGTSLTMVNGTISNNGDTAIGNGGTVTLTNVTISGNTAVNGAGIDNKAASVVNLVNVTINGNIANAPANIGGIRNAGTVNLKNTIISNNTPVNCSGAFASQGNNIENTNTCGLIAAGDAPNTNPLLGPLALNGGTLLTHALVAGSPAIDKGTAIGCPATDERGIGRPVDGNIPLDGVATCDIGAFEFRPQKITVTLPPPFAFGDVTTGSTSDHLITLSNAGDGALIIGTIAIADPLAAPFSMPVDNCSGLTLPLGGNCTITARFAPTAVAVATDTFNIPSNDPATATVAFALSGTGTASPVAIISVTDSIAPANDNAVPFGNITIGNTADATITITNAGTGNLVIGTIASANPLADPFSKTTDGCSSQTLAPAATCTFTIHFAPTANSVLSDTFDIPSNEADKPTVTMNVSGAGISASGNNPPSQPVLVSPSNGQTGLGTTVQLTWIKSVDPDGDAVTYHVSNCVNADFSGCTPVDVASAAPSALLFAGLGSFGAGIILVGFVAGSGMKRSRKTMFLMIALVLLGALFMSCHKSSGGEETGPAISTADQMNHSVTGLAPGTTYYWKVVADDGKGALSPSETWSYKTQ
jgi:CSLREA domain-containing protein